MSIRLFRMIPAVALVPTLALSLLMSTGCDLLTGPSTSDPSRFDLGSTLVPNVDLDIYVYVRQEYPTTVPGDLIGHPADVEVESLALWGLATDEEFTIGGALTFVSETDADRIDARIFSDADTWVTLSGQTIYFVQGTGAHAETLRTAITNKDFKYYDDRRALAEVALLPDGGNTKRGAVAIVKSSDALLELIARNTDSQTATIVESLDTQGRLQILIIGLYWSREIDIADLARRMQSGSILEADLGMLALAKSSLPGLVVEPVISKLLNDAGYPQTDLGGSTVYQAHLTLGRTARIPVLIRVEGNRVFAAMSGQQSYAETLITSVNP